MKFVNVQEAKTHLSRLVDAAVEGEEIIIGKHGKPLARLSAYAVRDEPRPVGGWEDRVRIGSNFDDEDPGVTALFEGES